MANSHEGGSPSYSEAGATLQQLLDRQLSTTGRQDVGTRGFQGGYREHALHWAFFRGVASLAEFQEHAEKQRQADEKAWALRELLQSKGFSDSEIKDQIQKIGGEETSLPLGTADKGVPKRKRYGAHPRFIEKEEAEQQQEMDRSRVSDMGMGKEQQRSGQHATVPSSSRRIDVAPPELMTLGGRKVLLNLDRGELYKGSTPQERARLTEENGPRSVTDVFASPAPPVLDMYTYLEQRRQEMSHGPSHSDKVARDDLAQQNSVEEKREAVDSAALMVTEVPEEVIAANRMSEEEIRELPGGKFLNYAPGNPSNTLYIKNLAPGLAEPDFVGVFGRFEASTEPKLIYRLMQRGRMKGQAFITFADVETARSALKLANGYVLKGKPMVIEFARGVKPSTSVHVEGSDPAPARLRRRKAIKDRRSA